MSEPDEHQELPKKFLATCEGCGASFPMEAQSEVEALACASTVHSIKEGEKVSGENRCTSVSITITPR